MITDNYLKASEDVQSILFDIHSKFDGGIVKILEIGKSKILDFDIDNWGIEVKTEVVTLMIEKAKQSGEPKRYLESLKLYFEAELTNIEKKHGTDEFDRDNIIIMGVKFHSDNTNTNEARYFLDCIRIALGNTDTEKPKHKYKALLSNKYNAEKIYDTFFNGEIALCTKDCFNDWFVYGNVSGKITPTLLGKMRKNRKKGIAIAQIMCFIETITGNTETLKDGYYKNVFGLELNNTKTAKNLSIEHEDKLKLCEK